MLQQRKPLTEAEYWEAEGWHSTYLRDALKLTGRGYHARHKDPERKPFVPNEAMRQGSLVDCLITQPDQIETRYAVLPVGMPKRPTELQLSTGESSKPGTKARAAWEDAQAREAEWLDWEQALEGREIVPGEWIERAERIRDVLLADPEVGARLRDASPTCQAGWQWMDQDLGLCLYKPDLETQSGGLWDLKKSRSASPRMFRRAAYDYGYDLQLAHYEVGYIDQHWGPPSEVGIIAYEFDSPFDYALLPATSEFLAYGKQRRLEAYEKIMRWNDSEFLASYGVEPLDVPAWVKGREPEPEPVASMEEIALF